MPWTLKQQKLARAVQHGFHLTGKAKGFTADFAKQVTVESNSMPTRKPIKKRKKGR